jgi:hypothetical protein
MVHGLLSNKNIRIPIFKKIWGQGAHPKINKNERMDFVQTFC